MRNGRLMSQEVDEFLSIQKYFSETQIQYSDK